MAQTRLEALIPQDVQFESSHKAPLLGRMLIGQVDVKQDGGACLWELKCVGHLESIHALQLVIYAWLVEHDIGTTPLDRAMYDAGIKPARKPVSKPTQLLLYNIKTDQLMEVSLSNTSADPLGQIIYDTIQERYGRNGTRASDTAFIKMCRKGYRDGYGAPTIKRVNTGIGKGGKRQLRMLDSSSDED